MSERVVQKYGGSSMSDVAGIRAVAQRVVDTRRAGHEVVVVVSAMGNTTNELLALANQVSLTPGRRELDLLISVGERVSMTLLAMAIQDLGEPAASFTGSQSGIITDECHANATVLAVKPHRIEAALAAGQIAIVAGFQGVSESGNVTTLGRGGSDTTAVVLTAALGAAHCEICSDVDGVYTADPRVVAEAQRMSELSLDSAISLAQNGAKVLLVDALEQAKAHGVELHAAPTAGPPGSGTRVVPGAMAEGVVGIAANEELVQIELSDEAGIAALPPAVCVWLPSEGRITALVDGRNLDDASTWALPQGAILHGAVATVSVVGRLSPTMVAEAVAAVREIDPQSKWWATDMVWSAQVSRSQVVTVTRALHARFIEG